MTIAKPTQVATPFANSGLKNTIPQSATGSNLASLEEGFPAVTMTAVADGGTPPQGQDFNGILNQVTNQLRYSQAGGLYPYDATFCTAIGGYPLGAILMSADGSKLWQNQVAGNTNNPDSDDTNWTELCTVAALTAGLATKQGTLTFDSTPTANSSNPVTSGGVKTALDGKLSQEGGEITGNIDIVRNNKTIGSVNGVSSSSAEYISLRTSGAEIEAFTSDSPSNPSSFNLRARSPDGNTLYQLRGYNNGKLFWVGNEVTDSSSFLINSYSSGSVTIAAGAASSPITISYATPTGYKYVSALYAGSQGSIVPCYISNSSAASATIYARNASSASTTCTFSVKVLFVRG